jgi:hypothetical protein
MPSFRTVSAGRAGPSAVGILVPPGSRTLVVVRPRALPIDLVLVRRRSDDQPADGFFQADRQTAGMAAQELAQALAEQGAGRVEAMQASGVEGFHVVATVNFFVLVACGRQPGQPYRPMVYSSAEAAHPIVSQLRCFLSPPTDANQELYTNMSRFGRC